MATQLSPLQFTQAKSWMGMTTDNYLGAIFEQAPQKASDVIGQIQQVNFGNNIESLLKQFPIKEFDDDRAYTWELASQAVNNIPLTEARINGSAVTAGDRPGKNHTEFELVFPKKWFSDVNRIVGEKNELYPIQILDEPTPEGSNWVYRVKLMLPDPNASMPVEELQGGKLFSKEYSPVEPTLSKKGGEIHFKSNISLRNEFSMIRMQHTTPGNMMNKKMTSYIKDEKGNRHQIWTRYEDYKFDYEFMQEKNKLLMFGTSNRREDGTFANVGKSGYQVREGAGIRQQIESSNTSFYNQFNMKDLIDRLMDISEGKVDPANRHYILRTGERGARLFSEALESYSQSFTPARDYNQHIQMKGQGEISQREFSYGGQFTELIGPNMIRVTLTVDSMYDDRTRNKLPHPDGGVAESYRFDIFDIGSSEEPNIQLVRPKGLSEGYAVEPGLRNPYSPVDSYGSNKISNPIDGYVKHRWFQGGAMVKDPSKTASLIPDILN